VKRHALDASRQLRVSRRLATRGIEALHAAGGRLPAEVYAGRRCRADPRRGVTEQRRRFDERESDARAERFNRRADSSAFLTSSCSPSNSYNSVMR
jgi:hypothetical protein